MQGYESIIILDPNATEEDQTGLLEKFKVTVEGEGGNVLHQTPWGRRKLAYPVNKKDYGYYHLMYFDRTPQALTALERVLRYDENVLKWMTVFVEDVDEEFNKFEKLKTEGSIAQNLSDR
ncbi:MAG: 30S ribosomal protein S6 [SAR324 cluster bacterium]|nr:30S ribosomal protein S6 [SAR324 cluster bacterium]MCZ6627124.1 30S ribosomal protein S6 [SAR324 cluster bacterium]